MKLAFLLLSLCAFVIAALSLKASYKIADKAFLKKQKDVLMLFNYINQLSYNKEFIEIAEAFKWENMWELWTNPVYAMKFWFMYQNEILPKGEIFCVFYPEHLKQAIALFKTLYFAKDYETFFKIAVWARQKLNEGLFVYALSVAIFHSPFTQGILLPPIYEIFPNYFFNDEVINKAQQYKQHSRGTPERESEIKDPSFKGYTLQANYSGWYKNVHPEQLMTYFTEDIGVNSFYYYFNIYNPWWMPAEMIELFEEKKRGEYFYWFYQQFLARYYLERLSNNMGAIPQFSYEHPIKTGYYPNLSYANGLHFPARPNHAELYYHGAQGKQSHSWYDKYTFTNTYVKDYEHRLRDALDRGFFWTPDGNMAYLFDKDGVNTLANLIESNYNSDNSRYYGDLLTFSRFLLGYSYYPMDEYKLAPSALEHFETSLRDPMFYQMLKRIMYYFQQHQQYTGPYEKKELKWDGIKIEDVIVDRLMTYFDYFYSDISNALTMDENEFNDNSFLVRARQYRLNHKAFNYKIVVSSNKPVEAFVKVFIGPKYDECGRKINIDLNRNNFFELDRFHYTLPAGKNMIERNSTDSIYFSRDRTTYLDLYKQVMAALQGGEQFKYYPTYMYYTFPQRMILPKGDFGGKTYQFFVMVVPYHEAKPEMNYFVDTEYSLAYPFDRPIKYEKLFEETPNFFFKDIYIYHNNTEPEINTTLSNH